MDEETMTPETTDAGTEQDKNTLASGEADENELAASAPPAPAPSQPSSSIPPPPAPEFHLPAVSDLKQQATDTATKAVSQAKDTAGQALNVARKQVTDQLTAQKNRAADSLGGIKDSFTQIGDTFDKNGQTVVAQYATSLGDQVDKVAGYLRDSDLETLGRDAQVFAKQNPAIVIGGAFLVGVALARFFKSSEANAGSSPGNGALVRVSQATSPSFTPPTERQDVDLDDAFTPGNHPLTANGYVSGGVMGGAPA